MRSHIQNFLGACFVFNDADSLFRQLVSSERKSLHWQHSTIPMGGNAQHLFLPTATMRAPSEQPVWAVKQFCCEAPLATWGTCGTLAFLRPTAEATVIKASRVATGGSNLWRSTFQGILTSGHRPHC